MLRQIPIPRGGVTVRYMQLVQCQSYTLTQNRELCDRQEVICQDRRKKRMFWPKTSTLSLESMLERWHDMSMARKATTLNYLHDTKELITAVKAKAIISRASTVANGRASAPASRETTTIAQTIAQLVSSTISTEYSTCLSQSDIAKLVQPRLSGFG